MIIQLKVQNHGNTFKTIPTAVLLGLLFQMFQKTLWQELKRHHILLYGNPDLNEQKNFEILALRRNSVTLSN